MGRKNSVILSGILLIFEVLSALFLTPVIIKNLGPAEYGVFKLTSAVSSYLLLLDLGTGGTTIRFIAKYNASGEHLQAQRFFGVAQIYYIIVAAIAGLCGIVMTAIFPSTFAVGLSADEIQLAQKLLLVLTLNAMVNLITAVFSNILIAYSLFSISRGFSIVQIILRIAVTLLAMHLGFRSLSIVIINLCMTILCRGGYIVYVLFVLKFRPVFTGLSKSFVFEIIGFSTWILLQLIATQINACADQILLGIFVANAAVIIAVYDVGALLLQYFKTIGAAFSDILMPGVTKMVETGATPSDLQAEMIRIGRIVLLALFAVLGGFFVYGKQFILLWTGEGFENGYYVALILMFAHCFICAETIGTQILWAKNEHRELALLKMVIVAANIALTILLIRWNPLLGATIGTFLSLFFGDIVAMNVIFKKKLGLHLKNYYAGLLKGTVPTLLLAVLINAAFSLHRLPGWWGLIIHLSVYCITYVGLAFLLGMNTSEKNMVLSLLTPLKLKRNREGDKNGHSF